MIGFKLEPMFTASDMRKITDQMQAEIKKQVLAKLIQVCDKVIDQARSKQRAQRGYDDDTGNLRSSTGFIIYHDGKIEYRNFKLSDSGTDKQTGLKVGVESATSELRGSKGWGVVLVAGMEYASWVENKGYDVLSGSRIGLEGLLQQAFNEIGEIK